MKELTTYKNKKTMIKVRFKKLDENAVIPTKAHDTDAAYDLVATSMNVDNGHFIYGTGIALEIPKGYAGYVYPRSSVRKHGLMMVNSVGVIDADYRGEVMLTFAMESIHMTLWGHIKQMLHMGLNDNDFVSNVDPYVPGDRIGQLVIRTAPKVDFVEAEELTETERGEGGHGSTGR